MLTPSSRSRHDNLGLSLSKPHIGAESLDRLRLRVRGRVLRSLRVGRASRSRRGRRIAHPSRRCRRRRPGPGVPGSSVRCPWSLCSGAVCSASLAGGCPLLPLACCRRLSVAAARLYRPRVCYRPLVCCCRSPVAAAYLYRRLSLPPLVGSCCLPVRWPPSPPRRPAPQRRSGRRIPPPQRRGRPARP